MNRQTLKPYESSCRLPPVARLENLAELETIECVAHGVVSGSGAEHATLGIFVKVRLLKSQTLFVLVICGPGGCHVQIAVVSGNQLIKTSSTVS